MTLTMTCLARYRRHLSGLTAGRNMWESTELPVTQTLSGVTQCSPPSKVECLESRLSHFLCIVNDEIASSSS